MRYLQFSGSAANSVDDVYHPLPAPSGDIPSVPLAQEESAAYHRHSSFDILQPDVRFRRQHTIRIWGADQQERLTYSLWFSLLPYIPVHNGEEVLARRDRLGRRISR